MRQLLIVDDSETMRRIIVRVLKQADLDVDVFLEAESGRAALDIVGRESGLCAVLCDISMPGMDGVELVRLLRTRSEVPVLMLATESQRDLARAALASGANGWVTKPFTPESIRLALAPYGWVETDRTA